MPKTTKSSRKLDLDNPTVQIQSKIPKTTGMVDKSWAQLETLLSAVHSSGGTNPGQFSKPMLAKPSKSVAESLPKPGIQCVQKCRAPMDSIIGLQIFGHSRMMEMKILTFLLKK